MKSLRFHKVVIRSRNFNLPICPLCTWPPIKLPYLQNLGAFQFQFMYLKMSYLLNWSHRVTKTPSKKVPTGFWFIDGSNGEITFRSKHLMSVTSCGHTSEIVSTWKYLKTLAWKMSQFTLIFLLVVYVINLYDNIIIPDESSWLNLYFPYQHVWLMKMAFTFIGNTEE